MCSVFEAAAVAPENARVAAQQVLARVVVASQKDLGDAPTPPLPEGQHLEHGQHDEEDFLSMLEEGAAAELAAVASSPPGPPAKQPASGNGARSAQDLRSKPNAWLTGSAVGKHKGSNVEVSHSPGATDVVEHGQFETPKRQRIGSGPGLPAVVGGAGHVGGGGAAASSSNGPLSLNAVVASTKSKSSKMHSLNGCGLCGTEDSEYIDSSRLRQVSFHADFICLGEKGILG